jgi:hypothetical protein
MSLNATRSIGVSRTTVGSVGSSSAIAATEFSSPPDAGVKTLLGGGLGGAMRFGSTHHELSA